MKIRTKVYLEFSKKIPFTPQKHKHAYTKKTPPKCQQQQNNNSKNKHYLELVASLNRILK